MRTGTRLALIGLGYVAAVAAGVAAVMLNELRLSADAASDGMAAFGDLVLFFGVAGVLGLAPTWFLAALLLERRRGR
jgi:hypothetical protein